PGWLGGWRCGGTGRRLEKGEAARVARRRRAGRPEQPGIARIAAGVNSDLVGDLPGVLQCRGEHACGALAQSIITAAAVERADARLEADAAAVAGWANGRPDHLGAECGAEHSRCNRGRRAAARSAWRAAEIMRVAGTARLGGGKLGGHGLADDDRPGLAECRDARAVAFGAPVRKQRGAVLGRHVSCLDDVLDAERHAIDRRALPALAPTPTRLIGSGARAHEIEMYEGADLRLERSKISETALEGVTRRVDAICNTRGSGQVGLRRELELLFGR